jgi:pyruvate/2-oxoglutarate dehydrogenase complex dihydrolipoamide dehydrogenase (E3) component
MRDLVVVGGGAAGAAAALAARERGWDVVLVEGRGRPGRALLESALADTLAWRPLPPRPPGSPSGESLPFRQAIRAAGERAAAGTDRRDGLLARRGVARLVGRGRLTGEPGVVLVGREDSGETLRARHVLLATGGRPIVAQRSPAQPFADERIRLADEASPPESAIVVGGGRQGVALAGLLACAGCRVVLVEKECRLLPHADADLSLAVARALEAAGVRVFLSHEAVDMRAARVVVARTARIDVTRSPPIAEQGDAGGEQVLEASRVYAAGARAPDLACLPAELAAAVTIPMPAQEYRTAIPWLLVAGSASGRALGTEAAQREGRAAVALLAGEHVHVPERAIPRFVAGIGGGGWVGAAEVESVREGHSVLVGRATLAGQGSLPPGFVKVVVDRGSQRLLGVHVAGSQGREAVVLAAALLELGAGRPELAAMAFPPGSPAEALAEAAASASTP